MMVLRLSWTLRPGLAASAALLLLGMTTPQGLTISQPWMRFVTSSTPAAGYFTLINNGDHPVSLNGAASPDCGQLMLHHSVVTNGSAQMKMVQSIVVPSHGSVTFAPGRYHLMCVSPAAAVMPGHEVPVTLRFQDGSALPATFPVYGAKGK